jgi:hypothetical protein
LVVEEKGYQDLGRTTSELPVDPFIIHMPPTHIADFIDRKALFGKIKGALSRPEPGVNVAVLIGMGGAGKSQLAMKYCQIVSQQQVSVFWANASSEQDLNQSYSVLAEKISKALGVNTAFSDLNSSVQYVKESLCSSFTRWVLVFDNYDVPSEFGDIRSFIPAAFHGSIIVTSRHPDAARLGVGIEVNGMDESEALELLMRRTGSTSEAQNVEHGKLIVKRLGYLPLAIDQAGSYIRKQSLPLSEFMNHYNKRREHVLRHTPNLWEYKKRLSAEERESTISVFTTWELSFEQLQLRKMEKEISLIRLLGFFHCASISQEVFQAYAECSSHCGDPVVSFFLPSLWTPS